MADLITPVPAGTPVTTVAGALEPIPDAAGADAMGLVTDSPAPLSMLGRLKAVAVALAGTLKVAAADGMALATAARQDAALAASHAVAIVPSDSADLAAVPVGIYVGTGGDLAMVASGDGQGAAPVIWKAVAAGSLIPLRARRIYATGTTAADLLAVYS